MCGIAAVVSSFLTAQEKGVFCDLLRVNTLRGPHSTGIIAALRTGNERQEYLVHKTTRNAVSALEAPSADLKAIFQDKRSMTALIGHTRSATKGSIKLSNAHPFIFPRVIGVHNGTINTHLVHQKDYETDSEALYRAINDEGLLPALRHINKGFPNYALVMIDKVNNEFVCIRNPRRPLHFTFNKDETTMFISSEAGALKYVLSRHGLTFKEQVFPQLKEDVLLRVPITFDALSELAFDTVDTRAPFEPLTMGTYKSGVFPGKTEYVREPKKTVSVPQVTPPGPVSHGAAVIASVNALKPTSVPISKKARKKFMKQLRKQARVSAMMAKKQAEDDDKESERFGEGNTPSFLAKPTAATNDSPLQKVRRYLKTVPITEDGKSAVLHRSALFDDVKDNIDERSKKEKEAYIQGGKVEQGEQDLPFNDPLPQEMLEDIDETEDCVSPDRQYIGYNGEALTRDEIEDRLLTGCQSCNRIEDVHLDKVWWIGKEEYVCGACAEDPQIGIYFGYAHKPNIH